jgi:hypothetical protein
VELRAWSELMQVKLSPWQAETLRMMSFTAMKEARSG